MIKNTTILILVSLLLTACNLKKTDAEITPVPQVNSEVYLAWIGENTVNGYWIGCDAYSAIQSADLPVSDDVGFNIITQLEYLLNLDIGDPMTTGEGLINPLFSQPLSLDSVNLEGDLVNINFTGNIQLVGVCFDSLIENQILLNVFNNPQVNSAYITVEGRNIREIFDMSGGAAGLDPIYTREKLSWSN